VVFEHLVDPSSLAATLFFALVVVLLMCFVNNFVSLSPVSLRIGVLYHSNFFSLLLLLIRSITTIEQLRAPPGCLVFVLPATLFLSSRCCADCGFVSVARLRCEFGKLGSRSLVLFLLLLLHRFLLGTSLQSIVQIFIQTIHWRPERVTKGGRETRISGDQYKPPCNLFALFSVSFHCVCERDRRRHSTSDLFSAKSFRFLFSSKKKERRAATLARAFWK
jgi:hypothetical protein